jgi:hypothetical protein
MILGMKSLRSWAVVAVVTPLLALGSAPAHAQGPDAQGWWSAVHRSAVPAAPPAAPDVAADDLLLQGGDPARLLPSGVVDQTPAPSALAALRFQVAPSSEVGALVLQVGAGAQASDVRAYPTDSAWKPAQGGAIEDAPTPDYSRYSSGRLSPDGTTLTFPDIGRLVTDEGLLSVVLVPGAADRVVAHKPSPTALVVLAPEPVELPKPTTSPSVPAPGIAPGVRPVLPGLGPTTVVAPTTVPSVAPPVVVPQQAAPVTTRVAVGKRLVPDDTRDRLAVLLEALLVLAFFGLLGQGPLAFLARLTGDEQQVASVRGVGRFASSRVGQAPRL